MKKQVRKSALIAVLVLVLLLLTVPLAFASGGGYHTVHYGETLYSIGRKYGVNPHRIANANKLYNPDYIYAGQVLYIPSGYDRYDSGYKPHDGYKYPDKSKYDGYKPHDGYKYPDKSKYDGYKPHDGYKYPDKSKYDGYNKYCDCRDKHGYGYKPSKASYYPDHKYDSKYHIVHYGETLTRIAYRYGVSPLAIAKVNKIYNLDYIYAGQVLYIPSGYY